MPIRTNDELATILGDGVANSRVDNWLWHYLLNHCGFQPNSNAKYLDRSLMSHFINMNGAESSISNKLQENLIPENLLEWITDDERQIGWIFSRLNIIGHQMPVTINGWLLPNYKYWSMQNFDNQGTFSANCAIRPGLTARELAVLLIDLNQSTRDFKMNLVNFIKYQWLNRKHRDQIFDWFAEYDINKYQILESTLRKDFSDRFIHQGPILNYQDLLIKFDQVNFTDYELKNLVAKCRTAFNQRLRRAQPDGKRQCNLLISESSIIQLEKLAMKFGLSKAQVMEALIKNEYRHELYLKERVEYVKKLLS